MAELPGLSALLRARRSITFRVVGLSSLLAVVAMFAIATLISTLYESRAERSFEELLAAHLFHLLGAVRVDDSNRLTGEPNLGDLAFVRPASGYYWEVVALSGDLTGQIRSPSMVGPLPVPSPQDVPFDDDYRRLYTVPGLAGEEVRVLETEYLLDSEDRVVRFRVTGNHSQLIEEIAGFNRRVFLVLTLFGLAMVVINAGAILLGLRPLGAIRRSLTEVREGKAQRLDGAFPPEIAPLVVETNALIDNNRRIVERYRTQVGNLAHSLKTPLAVIINEGRSEGGERGRLIAEQATAMQSQIEHYLQRARIAAQRDSVIFRTPVAAPLERLVRVLQKLHPEKRFELSVQDGLIFAGEREDLDEIAGNLLENAVKWSRGTIRVRAETEDEGEMFRLVIEDDGPGIPESGWGEAVKRGRRLDETKPGTGLGLSIVADMAAEYRGALTLGRSPLGGLLATVRLPGGNSRRP